MHVSKIVLTLGCTINTGNYENIRRDVQVEVVADSHNGVMFEYAKGKARQFLAMSLVDEFAASFDVIDYQWTEGSDALRERMMRNPVFRVIQSNDSALADDMVTEQWEKLEAYRTEQEIKQAKERAATAESEASEIPFELYEEREIEDEPGDN